VRDADRIVVLNHGRVAESGKHGELMAIDNGIYQRLYLLQQLDEDVLTPAGSPPPTQS
jgi:ATP-binding cassette subfamily B protein/ATP-binding cassette subfamily C protein/ATP-binding cassette subfamily B multidrug efflux pump